MKITKSLFFTLLFVFILVGCNNKDEVEQEIMNNEQVQALMLEQLKEKYNQEFQMLDFSEVSIMKSYYTMKACVVDADVSTESFFAYYFPEERQFKDGYFGILVRPEIETMVSMCINEFSGDYKVYVNVPHAILNSSLDEQSNYANAREVGELKAVDIYVFQYGESINPNELISRLKEKDIEGMLLYFCLSNSDDYNAIERSTYVRIADKIFRGKEIEASYEEISF